MTRLPDFETLLLERKGRRLTITMDQPETLNAFGGKMHVEIEQALAFAGQDDGSDVIVVTGAGRAFSAGGDIARMQHFVDHPDDFEEEVQGAKRLIFTLLDIEKPVIARINGPAVGLGATIALFCDVTIASDTARIGDPHVAIGLVAGDGGAVIWPQLVGFHRAKEFLLTGEILTAARAAEIGLVNHVVPEAELDAAVDALCDRLLKGAQQAIRWTKVTINIELKRIAHALMDPGLAYESLSVRTDEHAERVKAFVERAEKKR
ncbi:enoyl-CoA hydratase/isomerase family protein [Chachezhania antarctica]|uniref:enoyl-CoA hydratase/isomerase family protein n=1 Tax=Chachezhania antarctica TaxID=2340860 RepID=UPI000EABCC32|nr:enoyl-CoA hydratase/isomerase family protein [Chachezhania antarctica]|tara:strand:- start:1930 stop:2718 length:789 start_codon:yes stop_codon:yes gene_type:complete